MCNRGTVSQLRPELRQLCPLRFLAHTWHPCEAQDALICDHFTTEGFLLPKEHLVLLPSLCTHSPTQVVDHRKGALLGPGDTLNFTPISNTGSKAEADSWPCYRDQS